MIKKPFGFLALSVQRWICTVLIVALLGPFLSFPLEAAVANKVEPLVAVLVEEELYDTGLRGEIDRYLEDIGENLPAHTVLVEVPASASAFEIYEGLKDFYFSGVEGDEKTQLRGIVLIGQVPLPIVDKNGALYPSVFPYVDLEHEVYHWNPDTERFTFDNERSMVPEIWHGLIRTNPGTEDRVSILENYFDENHRVQNGDQTYSPRIFLADLENQRKVLPEIFNQRYRQWIEYADDILYHRWSGALLERLFPELSPQEIEGVVQESMSSEIPEDVFKYLPDIQAKDIIDFKTKRYLQLYNHWLDDVYEDVFAAGRWSPYQIDTTMSLISRRDEGALIKMKRFNDLLEEQVLKAIREENFPADISVLTQDDYTFTDEVGTQNFTKPLYWNGVKRSEMNVEDCTLYRGTPPTENHPLSQQVLASRVWGGTFQGRGCATSESTPLVRYIDYYEGCCELNATGDADNNWSYEYCDGGSQWQLTPYNEIEYPVDYLEDEFLETYAEDLVYTRSNEAETEDQLTHVFEHQGAERPIFDLLMARAAEGPVGASGCAGIIIDPGTVSSDRVHTFSSLMVHNEPRPQTLKAQAELGISPDLPIDDPRGVSFYAAGQFYRLPFFDVFDLRGFKGTESDFEAYFESQFEDYLATLNEVATESNSRLGSNAIGQITNDVLDEVLEAVSFEDLYQALTWFDQDIHEKNYEAFEAAYGDEDLIESFYFPEDFEGYQLTQLVAEENDQGGINLDFEPFSETLDQDLLAAKQEFSNFEYETEDLTELLGDVPKGESPSQFRARKLQAQRSDCQGRGTGWIARMRCSIEQLLGMPVPEANEAEEEVPEEEAPRVIFTPDQNMSLQINPSQVVINSTQRTPLNVEVLLIDDNVGAIRRDDFQTLVSLNFTSSDGDRFLNIRPGDTLPVTAGRAQFTLVPQPSNLGGRFELEARAYNQEVPLATGKIPVTVSRHRLVFEDLPATITASPSQSMTLRAKVVDPSGQLVQNYDDTDITFALQDGYGRQQEIGQATITNGLVEISYIPEITAPKVSLVAFDPQAQMAPASANLTVQPGPVKHLLVLTNQNYLLPHRPLQLQAQLVDELGNPILNQTHQVTWRTTNLEALDQAEKDTDPRETGIQDIVTGISQMTFLPREGDETATIRVESDGGSEPLVVELEFDSLENPNLVMEATLEQTVAGEGETVLVNILATNNGVALEGQIPLSIKGDPIDFAAFPSEVFLQDGQAQFTFVPRSVAGDFELEVSAPGFPRASVPFRILPANAEKIELKGLRQSINLEEDQPIAVEVTVFDRFQNPMKDFNGVVEVEVTGQTQPLVEENQISVEIQNGKGVGQFTPQGRTGTLHLVATHETLIGDTLELPIIKSYDREDWASLSPKSLVSFALGFGSGDLSRDHPLALDLLSQGKTQAIGAQIASKDPGFTYGYVGNSGSLSPSLRAQFLSGGAPTFLIGDDRDFLAQARWHYPEEIVSLAFGKDPRGRDEILIKSQNSANLTLEGRTILLNGVALAQIEDKGGLEILDRRLTLEIKENQLNTWKLMVDGEMVGLLGYSFTAPQIEAVETFRAEAASQGLQIKALLPRVAFEKAFTGKTTNDERGLRLKDPFRESPASQRLGSTQLSVEEVQLNGPGFWRGAWKPATHLAGGNSIGASTQSGSSDIFVLFGDPTLSLDPRQSLPLLTP